MVIAEKKQQLKLGNCRSRNPSAIEPANIYFNVGRVREFGMVDWAGFW
ncbi:hypothetical protein IQ269_27830 [Tychonema sp. LEGE 07199]|nr:MULTISPECIES: hypothetical protein [unclassified Tychonema]MBE9124479.1 hypothetical protein [Tychonema sp. LEGE 07199]MBE9133578.1 hypothetical protein [Tychonema sp. LEGE 07196]